MVFVIEGAGGSFRVIENPSDEIKAGVILYGRTSRTMVAKVPKIKNPARRPDSRLVLDDLSAAESEWISEWRG